MNIRDDVHTEMATADKTKQNKKLGKMKKRNVCTEIYLWTDQ